MRSHDLLHQTKYGAGCLLFVPESKKFLLIKRSDFVPTPLTWCFPGGGVDSKEDPKVAAIRECREEVGYQISRDLHLLYTNETHAPRFKFFTYVSIIEKTFHPKLNWESCDYMWTTIDELPTPLHWGVSQLFASERAANALKKLVDTALMS
jgi:uncharacterized protein